MTHGYREFAGTDRFQIVRRLGMGATGVVYAVRDRERSAPVALKTLLWADSAAIYRLKREFRSLADVVHPNIVTLYELMGHDDTWFFTMELVDGVGFVDHVRRGGLDEARLRAGLLQLGDALGSIHGLGKMHRDLKPSNVLVTPEGRVVVLDFGIAADLGAGEDPQTRTTEHGILGTVQYMAPEQAAGQAGPASDWYSLGVMMYEALTGRLPYRGSFFRILADKQTKDPEPANEVAPGIPRDLSALCMELLARDPDARPEGDEVLRRLAGRAPLPRAPAGPEGPPAIVGRESQLSELRWAYEQVGDGEAVSVYVHGPSGIGKSALVDHFLARVRANPDVVVLAGRCYVRESVPYKGLDGVVDSLSRFLRALPPADARALISPELRTLARLFPVLERIDAIAALPEAEPPIRDPVQLRRQGFAALRDLLRRICETRGVVVYIDDLQWSDRESLLLLEDLLGPPSPPGILLVVSLRDEDIAERPFLRSFLDRTRTTNHREIRLGPLSPAETRRLVGRLWGSARNIPGAMDAIATESAGNPFLIEQLVHHGRIAREPAERADRITLGDMLEDRIRKFPQRARELLETLAVAGRPVDPRVLREATGVEDERALAALLETEHCVRRTGAAGWLELYHDRLREVLVAAIPAARAHTIHLRLAEVTEASDIDDPEGLYEHYMETGQRERAAACAALAALKADNALAFDRAAFFYRRALELDPAAHDSPALRVELGDALANAGRGPEAARAYLAAAEGSEPLPALDLRRLAAEQLLRCGHVDQGLAIARDVLSGVGLRLARSPEHALLRLLARRAYLRLRGLRFSARPETDVDPLMLRRIDACWTISIGLARVDNIRAAEFQALNLLLALRAGEPFRIARALAAEAAFVSTAGRKARRRAARLVEVSRGLADRIDDPRATAFARFAAGITSFWAGRFGSARENCEAAERLLRERCTGVVWEINTSQTFTSSSLVFLGQLLELSRRLPIRLREAREHGDLYAAADVTAGRPIVVWLARGDVEGARTALAEGIGAWSFQGFHLQHYFSTYAQAQIDLYEGDGTAAWSRISERWRELRRSMLLRVQLIRLEAIHLHARCALAAAMDSPSARDRYIAIAERGARRIAREKVPWAAPLADLVHAGARAARGDMASAVDFTRSAVSGFERGGLAAYAAVSRRRCAELMPSQAGAAMADAAKAWMDAQRIADPARFTDMLAPGFPPAHRS